MCKIPISHPQLAEFSKMEAQIKDLKSREDQIVQQLEEQKTKNDVSTIFIIAMGSE
jgi:hypothetical protein